MSRRRRHTIPPLARHSIGLALVAPQVVAQRVTRMWLAGGAPSRHDHDEFVRMWTEKPAAFFESWTAMVLASYRANLTLAMRIWGAGLAPVHRRAAANARRLRRSR